MLLALSEADQHLLTTGVVGLLFALGNYVTVKVVTAQQTRRIVGDPNGRGRRVGMTTEDVSLANVALAVNAVDTKVNALDRKVNAVDGKADKAATAATASDQTLKDHIADDDKRFAVLIPEYLHEKAGIPKPKPPADGPA